MSEYSVVIKASAVKEIDRLPIGVATRVIARIEALGTTPRPPGVRKLEGAPTRWRLRVGDWRVIYSIDDHEHLVVILYVRHRSKAYES